MSGGGKSTFLIETLYRAVARKLNNARELPGEHDAIEGLEQIDKIIDIDQSPIGRTPRSNPATYTGAFTPIREWFAELPEAKTRGYKPGRFSFNVKGGRCEACQGDGVIKIEMHFLPDIYVTCDVCKGKRYDRETLEIKFKGKSIADVLDMTVEEAAELFKAVPAVRDKLLTLARVGLGYIHVGQQATTLSGGEAQRIKLSKELSKRATGRTLYILDEPTTGLHFHDVAKLLEVLHELVDQGNTVVVIEHNLEVIKTADWIVDLGPEGGDAGGEVVAIGTPEEIAANPASYTGHYLKQVLARRPSSKCQARGRDPGRGVAAADHSPFPTMKHKLESAFHMTSRIVFVLVLLALSLPQPSLAEAAKPASVILLENFWRDVWVAKNPDAVDTYVTEDFVITSGGKDIRTRAAFKAWLTDFQAKITDMDFKVLETFQNEDGSRVVSRLKVTGKNNGLFGLPPDQKPFVLTAIAIWEVTPDGRLAHNWVERNGLEIYRQLTE